MDNVTLISAFPGVGKSTIYNNAEQYGFYPLKTFPGKQTLLPGSAITKGLSGLFDSDSSLFDKNNFPQNYIDHIARNSVGGEYETPHTFFVSSHANVREALFANQMEYVLVYPDKSLKDVWIQRYVERGSPEAFIKLLTDKWDDFIDSCIADKNAKVHIVLNENQGMVDVIAKLK